MECVLNIYYLFSMFLHSIYSQYLCILWISSNGFPDVLHKPVCINTEKSTFFLLLQNLYKNKILLWSSFHNWQHPGFVYSCNSSVRNYLLWQNMENIANVFTFILEWFRKFRPLEKENPLLFLSHFQTSDVLDSPCILIGKCNILSQ